MHQIFNFQIVMTNCPEEFRGDKCPARQYLASTGLFRETINESILAPTKSYADARVEFISAFDEVNRICIDCKSKKR
ncbi:MAG: hypothetical protein J6Y07_02830 [Alphaproteobacteria bacterium]|nr:hypothetical protein [Alphaproteobacteria bacterium]